MSGLEVSYLHSAAPRGISFGQQNNDSIWKMAVAFNLRKSIGNCNMIAKNTAGLSDVEKKNLKKSVNQLSLVLEVIQTETNPSVLEHMKNDPYTRESIQKLRFSVKSLVSAIEKFGYRIALSKVHYHKIKPVAHRSILITHAYMLKALSFIEQGGMMKKFHFTSKGSKFNYFKIQDGRELRWSNNKSKLNNPKKCHCSNHHIKRRPSWRY